MSLKKLTLAGVATLAVTGGMFIGTAAHAAPPVQTTACVVTYDWSHAPQTSTYRLVVDQPYQAAVAEVSHNEWTWRRTVEVPAVTHTESQYRKVIAHDALTHTEAQYRKVMAHPAVTHTETTTTSVDTPPAGEGWQLIGTSVVPGTPATYHTAWRWTRYVVTQEARPAYDEVVTPAWDEQVEHPAVTHTVHHEAVYLTVHHKAEYAETLMIKWVQNGGKGELWLAEGQQPTGGSWQRTRDTKIDKVLIKEAWDQQVLVKAAWDETVVDTPAYVEAVHHPAVTTHHDAVPEQGHWELSDYRATAPAQDAGWARTDDAIQISNDDGVPDASTSTWQRTVVDKPAWNTIDVGYFAQDPGGEWEATGKTRTVVDQPAWNTIDFGYFAQDPGDDWEPTGKTRTVVDTPAGTRVESAADLAEAPEGEGWVAVGDPVTVIDQPAVPEVAEVSHWTDADGIEVQPATNWTIDGDTATATMAYDNERAAQAPSDDWVLVAGSEQRSGDCDTAPDPVDPGNPGNPRNAGHIGTVRMGTPVVVPVREAHASTAHPAGAESVARVGRTTTDYPTSVDAGLPGAAPQQHAPQARSGLTALAGLLVAAAGAVALRISRRAGRA